MDNENQKTNNNQGGASETLKWLQDNQEESNNRETLKWLQDNQKKNNNDELIAPRQVMHHPVPTPSSPAQISRPIFRGRGRRSSGSKVGGAIKGGAKSAGKKLIKEGAKKLAALAMENPYFWAIVGIAAGIIVIIALIIIIAANICQLTSAVDFIRPDWLRAYCAENDTAEEIPPPPLGVTITKEAIGDAADGTINNGDTIDYRITVTYDSSIADTPANQMILVDLPEYDFDPTITTTLPNAITDGNTYMWNLTDLGQTPNGTITTYTARIILKPNVTDGYVVNNAYINISATPVAPTPPPGNTPTCPGGNYFACLSGQFNVDISGTSDQTKAKIIYDILAIPLKYPKYLSWFRSRSVNMKVLPQAERSDGAWMVTYANSDMDIYQNFFNSARRSTREQYMIHESAHAISWNSTVSTLQSQLYNQVYKRGLDSSCFRNRIGPLIKTFPYIERSYTNFDHEIFAESVADTLVCDDSGTCGPWGGGTISNFPRTCSNTYNFVKDNILQ